MHGLTLQYWESTILFAIVYAITTLLSIEELKKGSQGHFEHAQIDLNMPDTHDRILVECEGYMFFVELEYGSLTLFYDNVCVGHMFDKC